MIRGIEKKSANKLNQQNVLEEMQNSKFEFHMTGSRYHGNSRADSDWDFFAGIGHDESVIRFLEYLGFYLDEDNREDYSSILYSIPCGIHVVFIPDVDVPMKIRVNEMFRYYSSLKLLDQLRDHKDIRKEVWEFIERIFRG